MLYQLLSEINELARQRSTLDLVMEEGQTLIPIASRIRQSLEDWSIPYDGINDRELGELCAAADAFRWAAIIRLDQLFRHDLEQSASLTAFATEKVLSAVSSIRPGSPVETQLLFPLFMAGCGSASKASRLTAEYRLNIN